MFSNCSKLALYQLFFQMIKIFMDFKSSQFKKQAEPYEKSQFYW